MTEARPPAAVRQSSAAVRGVLFDLGGVLVRLGGIHEFGPLVGISDEGAIWRLRLRSTAGRRYERGFCSRAEFARTAVEEFRLVIPPEDLLFLDDNELDVEGARAVGLDAHRAVGVEQARAILAANDLLAR